MTDESDGGRFSPLRSLRNILFGRRRRKSRLSTSTKMKSKSSENLTTPGAAASSVGSLPPSAPRRPGRNTAAGGGYGSQAVRQSAFPAVGLKQTDSRNKQARLVN